MGDASEPIVLDEHTYGPLVLDEMIKILSLLENPPEMKMIRRALRYYEVPEYLTEFKWGSSEKIMPVLRHYALPQSKEELAWAMKHLEGKETLLTVGGSFGGTLTKMASVMNKGCQLVVVDLPCDDTPKFLNPVDSLKENCRKLMILGANVELFIGDSHSKQVIDQVSNFAPYDFGFIDGDHTYEGVKADWENYGPMCKVVGFHDIGGAVEGVKRFWDELKAKGEFKTDEFVADENPKFGIGLVFRE